MTTHMGCYGTINSQIKDQKELLSKFFHGLPMQRDNSLLQNFSMHSELKYRS